MFVIKPEHVAEVLDRICGSKLLSKLKGSITTGG